IRHIAERSPPAGIQIAVNRRAQKNRQCGRKDAGDHHHHEQLQQGKAACSHVGGSGSKTLNPSSTTLCCPRRAITVTRRVFATPIPRLSSPTGMRTSTL